MRGAFTHCVALSYTSLAWVSIACFIFVAQLLSSSGARSSLRRNCDADTPQHHHPVTRGRRTTRAKQNKWILGVCTNRDEARPEKLGRCLRLARAVFLEDTLHRRTPLTLRLVAVVVGVAAEEVALSRSVLVAHEMAVRVEVRGDHAAHARFAWLRVRHVHACV